MSGRKKEAGKTRLTRYCNQLGDGWLRTDGTVLYCDACDGVVSSEKKSLVKQHVDTGAHQNNVQKRKESKRPRQEFLAVSMRKAQDVRMAQVEFCNDLCRAFLAADIPLFKVNNEAIKQLFTKYTSRTVPEESTLRKAYVSPAYKDTLEHIRRAIGDSPVFIQVDETSKNDWKVAHCIVGTLKSDGPATRFLLHCEELERTNNQTVSQFVLRSLALLWPSAIQFEKVLLFVSDAASYMKKAYTDALRGVFPNLVHVTCIVHGLHRVA
jgi:hypothetical protein